LLRSIKFKYKVLVEEVFVDDEYVTLSMYFMFCEPYLPIIKFILIKVGEPEIEGKVRSEEESERYLGTDLPKIYEKSKGIEVDDDLQVIFKLCPNLKLTLFPVPPLITQFPLLSTN
jgi:hypothetical protein